MILCPLLLLCTARIILAAPFTDPRAACPNYGSYSQISHDPLTTGELQLPYQRPAPICRTFTSPAVEKVIKDVTSRMRDVDLARLFENAFPNTLDTTVSWHVDRDGKGRKVGQAKPNQYAFVGPSDWEGAQSFIVTGDITAEWIRDSTNQLQGYQALAKKDPALETLILGAINTQAEYIFLYPYCNAFQPPPPSGLGAATGGPIDTVSPIYNTNIVSECKYELDSLAHFLRLGNEFHKYTKSVEFLTPRFYAAIRAILDVLKNQSLGSFDEETGQHLRNEYRFQRQTTSGTETLSLGGVGNPIKGGTGLVRSAFRPSDDATILPFFIPANAMMSVELRRMAIILTENGKRELAGELSDFAENITQGIKKHGIVKHDEFGEVYAYEVDGYGSRIFMDDANLPSLLSLPHLGFVDVNDPIYQNTRRMILSQSGNPYYLEGEEFSGIGGPHIGLRHAWPMSRLVQAMTSDNDTEIMNSIMAVRDSSRLGLVHESVHVAASISYTRSWFAWANSVFAQTILDIAKRKPHLIFGMGAEPYDVESSI